MKGIAIGFSDTSKVILKRLKKTEFINEIYVGSSSKKDKNTKCAIEIIKPKQILREKWNELEKIGINEPWVSLKIPYIIPLALSFFVSALFGDLFSYFLVSPINSLFS